MHASTHLLTAVAVLAALAAVAVLALDARRRGAPDVPGSLGLPSVVAAAAAAAGVGVGATAVLAVGGDLSFFGLLHVAYLGLVVTVPVVAAVLLALVAVRRWQAGRAVVVLAAVGLVPAAVGAYATHVEPAWLRVDEVVVPVADARDGDDPVRVAVLADLQTDDVGTAEERAVDRLMAAEPDVILLPGDLFQGGEGPLRRELPALRALLGRLEAPGGVWFVRGDSEDGDRADRILDGLDVTILDDEVAEVAVGDRTLRIGGTRLEFWHDSGIAARRALEGTLETSRDDGTIRVLMAHRPDVALSLPPSSRVDLTVAGHTHGGQVVVPGVGPPIAFTEVPRSVARGGLHTIDGNPIYVSPGVGLERGQAPQVRLFNRPAVALLDLRDAR